MDTTSISDLLPDETAACEEAVRRFQEKHRRGQSWTLACTDPDTAGDELHGALILSGAGARGIRARVFARPDGVEFAVLVHSERGVLAAEITRPAAPPRGRTEA